MQSAPRARWSPPSRRALRPRSLPPPKPRHVVGEELFPWRSDAGQYPNPLRLDAALSAQLCLRWRQVVLIMINICTWRSLSVLMDGSISQEQRLLCSMMFLLFHLLRNPAGIVQPAKVFRDLGST